MIGLLRFVLAVLASPLKSKLRLQAENAVLRHQLIVLRRKLQGRFRLTNHDRWFFIQLYRWFPAILKVLTIIRPETLVKKISYVLAALATIAIAAPAVAQDKPMMKEGMHESMHHWMEMHHHHHHMMRREGM